MWRPRIIPVLLLRNGALVKSRRFKEFRYLGDPINAIRIFNEMKADELIFLDTLATREKRAISLDFVRKVGEEARMPFGVGGGLGGLAEIRGVLNAGAEKVILNTSAVENPDTISRAADAFGSSTISVCLDVRKGLVRREQVWSRAGRRGSGQSPEAMARLAERKGAGEIIVQSIPRDGMMEGYDLDLVRRVSESVTVPVVALGGAGTIDHLVLGRDQGFASGLAAGSMFVFHGPKRGVLLNYPHPG